MTIGFLGTGRMGSRIAAHILKAGHRLAAYDPSPEAARELAALGAECAASAAEAAEEAELVLVCVPGPAEFEACVLGPGGAVETIRAGATLIDHTTNDPAVVRRAHAALAAKGARLIDAPVSGGVSGAAAGTLTVQAGGDPDAVERCRPVLELYARTIVHTGGVGSGCVCKIAHNAAVFGANLAMMECMTMAVKAGVEPRVVVELFQRSGIGRNHDLQVSLPATLFRGDFAPRFAMETALKDMRLATGLAAATGVPAAVAALCEEEMREAVARGWGARDHAVYLTLQEERAGVKVRIGEGA